MARRNCASGRRRPPQRAIARNPVEMIGRKPHANKPQQRIW
jgi:hypothetical protein